MNLWQEDITGDEFKRKAAVPHHVTQATSSQGLAQGPYVTTRAVFEPAT